MAEPRRPEFEISRWERGVWAVQRAGWAVMGATLVAAALGLLGAGPLSRATARAPDGTWTITYERVVRLHAPRDLTVTAVPRDGRVRVDLETHGCVAVSLESGPTPEHAELEGAVQRYTFRAAGASPATAVLTLEPTRAGRCPMRARVNEGPWQDLRTLVLP